MTRNFHEKHSLGDGNECGDGERNREVNENRMVEWTRNEDECCEKNRDAQQPGTGTGCGINPRQVYDPALGTPQDIGWNIDSCTEAPVDRPQPIDSTDPDADRYGVDDEIVEYDSVLKSRP